MPEQTRDRSVQTRHDAQREALLDFAISQSSAIFYIADLEGARPVRFIGENVKALTGHEPEAFLRDLGFGRTLIHPDDVALYQRRVEQLAERGQFTHEYRFRCADGSYRWFRDEQRVIEAEGASPAEFIGCMTDITERVDAEQESRRLARLLRHAVETIPNGFAIYDADERLALCNTAFADIIGQTPDALDGSTAIDNARRLLGRLKTLDGKLVHDADASLPQALARWQESEHKPIEMELENGDWLQVTSHRIGDGGRVDIQTDITWLKAAETSLRESEEQFRAIVEANPSPVRVSDTETWEVLYESPAAAALFGHSWPARGGRVTSRNYVDLAERRKVIDTLQRERRLDNREILMRHDDGSTFWISLSCRVVRYRGKDVCVSSLVDLTESKAREAELDGARETLDDAIEALDEGLALFDAEDRLVLCNRRFREFHAPHDELLQPGRSWESLVRARVEAGLFASGSIGIEEQIARRKLRDGEAIEGERALVGDRWMQVSHRPTRQGGMVHTWRDVTESRRMAQELRDGEERVRSVLESCPVPVRMWRLESHDVLYESPASREMFGRDATKLTPEQRRIVYVDQADREPYIERLRQTGAVDNLEMQLRRADGSTFWGAVSARVIDYRGETVVVSSIVDLSERRAMEQALRESERHFRLLVEEHPLPVWMIETATGKLLYESPAAATLTGRQWEPGSERSVLGFWADINQRGPFLRLLQEQGELMNHEIALRRADGSVIPVSTNSRLINRGESQFHITALVDLSEQRRRETELSQARETLEDAIESLPEGFALFDADDRLLLCNSQFREFNAVSADMLYPGVTWQDFITSGARRGQYLDAIGREELWIAERLRHNSLGAGDGRGVVFQQSDGRWYHAFSQRTRQGGYVGIRIDITESKKLELALRESEEEVREILEAIPVPITMVRLEDARILYESPAAEAEFGTRPFDEASYATEFWVDLELRERLVDQLRREGILEDAEAEFRRCDGSTFWGSLSGQVITYRGEEVAVTTVHDLSERRAAQAKLAEQRERLHQSEKLSALGELLAGVSHELNNPLSVLVGQALMLKEASDDEQTRRRADKISSAADRCARIVKTFLSMARQEPSRMVPTQLDELIEGALDMTAYGLRTAGIEVTLELAEELPPVSADPDQLRQVLTNLLINAQHALQEIEGARRLSVSATRRSDPAGERVAVAIEDNGPGIPEEIRGRIFEPLYTTKEVGSGTGIGLALCHRIVAAHGGHIALSDGAAGGARFTLSLPAIFDPEGTTCRPDQRGADERAYRVLVIDDEIEVGEIISEVLEIDGHAVDVVTSGEDALVRLEAGSYDVILSDMRMPGMDGPSVHRRLKSDHPEQLAGLGFITGDTLSPRVKAFLEASGRPYLEKPLLPRDIREMVARLAEADSVS